ncbi:nitrogen fixation protein FixA, partial [Acidithiobacillus ferrooxidans]|nr:nitrogen fixation protein FixA [Acidithiobacillus ferrooxidans]
RSARFEVPKWNKERAGIEDVSKIGLKGSPTVVSKIFTPKPRAVKAQMIGADLDADGTANAILDILSSQHPRLAQELGLITP